MLSGLGHFMGGRLSRIESTRSKGIETSEGADETEAASSSKASAKPPQSTSKQERSRNVMEMAPLHVEAGTKEAPSAPPPSKAVPEERWREISSPLTRSTSNLLIGTDDAKRANDALARLSPDQFKTAMERMEREGLLSRFTSNLDIKERERFLELAARSGYLHRDAGAEGKGPLEPPGTPATFSNDPWLPKAVRDAVHDHTVASAVGYWRDYEAYLDRYEAAVEAAKSGAEIRMLGEPRRASPPTDSLAWNDPLRTHYTRDYLERVPRMGNHRAYVALSNRRSDLLGEARAGSVYVEGKINVRSENGAEAELSFRQHAGRSARDESKLKVEGDFGGVRAGVEHDLRTGKSSASGGMTSSVGGNRLKVKVKEDGSGSTELGAGRAGSAKVEFTADGRVKGAEVKVSGVGAQVGKDGVALQVGGGTAYANPTEGRFGARAEREFEVAGGKVRVELGAGFNGISIVDARHALASEGTHTVPPEIERGVAWDDLSEDARARVTRNLWTKAEWTEALARRR